MNDRNEKYIRNFITEIKKQFKQYNNLVIDFEYCKETDEYIIWHNNEELQFNNPDFLKKTGKLIKEILLDNNIYNFSFGYDHIKAKKIGEHYFIDLMFTLEKEVNIEFTKSIISDINIYKTGFLLNEPFNIGKNVLFKSWENNSSNFNSIYCRPYFFEQLETYAVYDNKHEERLAA